MFLRQERETLEQLLPGLDRELAARPLAELEGPQSPIVALFRGAHGPALLIPEEMGGRGASPVDAVRVQRALGSRSPSLAIISTMHNFSVATLVEFNLFGNESSSSLLESVAEHDL